MSKGIKAPFVKTINIIKTQAGSHDFEGFDMDLSLEVREIKLSRFSEIHLDTQCYRRMKYDNYDLSVDVLISFNTQWNVLQCFFLR